MPKTTPPIDVSRVEFVDENVLVGNRCYRAGDVADVPTDKLKELGSRVRSTEKEPTDFSGSGSSTKAEPKPKR